MDTLWKGNFCEILDLGGADGYRLYCEGISLDREKHILKHVNVEYLVVRKTQRALEGALVLDFNPEDTQKVLSYFGVREW